MALKDGSKSGGRKKGTPNKDTQTLRERAAALGVDPFEILLHFAAGNWGELGYDSPSREIPTKDGGTVTVDTISPELREKAAKDVSEYLYPKLKSIEHKGDGPGNPFNALAQAVASILKANPDAESKPGSSS